MNKDNIKKQLKEYNPIQVNIFCEYIEALEKAKNKNTGTPKNPWVSFKSDIQLADMFKQVNAEGLVFDGKIVSLLSTGISYSYMAYKNKMLLAYPESIIDIQLVYNQDTFQFEKKNGHVLYEHVINNAFDRNETDIIGGYVVIKNKRGEFLTLLSTDDIEKHRKVAKTDYIWKNWLVEMYYKTLMKKSTKQHFQDEFSSMENTDNTNNYDLDLPMGIDVKVKGEIEAIKTRDELTEYYLKNKDKNKAYREDFIKLLARRKAELPPKQTLSLDIIKYISTIQTTDKLLEFQEIEAPNQQNCKQDFENYINARKIELAGK